MKGKGQGRERQGREGHDKEQDNERKGREIKGKGKRKMKCYGRQWKGREATERQGKDRK